MQDTFETLLVTVDTAHSVAHITLNRPQARNAMNFQMVADLYEAVESLRGQRDVRALVLRGAAGAFCAGGDVKEMRENQVPFQGERVDLDRMLRAVNTADQVVISVVEGAALGGGLGLVCVSDIALATNTAQFGLPEVRLGVTPAFISPFVIERIGFTRARELMLTGRRFNGDAAHSMGLVHQSVARDQLDETLQTVLNEIRQCAPGAIAATKALMFEVKDKSLQETVAYRVNLLNTLRAGAEGQEGLTAFMEKRPARWTTGTD